MRDNENLRRALERLADEAAERPDGERITVARAKSRRRLTVGLASLSLLLVVGGISFAASSLVNGKATDLPITSGEEESTSARYFFRANGDGMEAHGVLEVHTEPRSICYEGTTREVAASHLVGLPDEDSDFPHPAPVLATFFEPGNENGATEPPGSKPICLRGEELGEMETQLQALIDDPHLFKIDFHGPDETTPTLEAELVPQAEVSPSPPSQDGWSFIDGPGWHRAEAPPEARTGAVVVWNGRQTSGRDLVMWSGESGYGTVSENNGFSWDAATNEWTPIADSPLEARAEAGSAWTGREIIIWGGYGQWPKAYSDGAAYDPDTDTWRMLPEAPLSPAAPVATVWTGEEVIVWGSTSRSGSSTEGAAYDPSTNEWRALPRAPQSINSGTGVWTAGDHPSEPEEMVILGAHLNSRNSTQNDHAVGIAYNPESNTWRRLPDVDLSPNGSSISWTGEEIVVWDGGLNASAYNPASNQWRHLPKVPFESWSCYPRSESIGSYVFAWLCGQAAVFDVRSNKWTAIRSPSQIVAGDPVAAGEVLLFAGATHEATHNALWIYSEPGRP